MARWSCTWSLERQQQQNSKLELEEGWVPSICLCTSLLLTGINPPAQYHPGWSKQRAENLPVMLHMWKSNLHCHFLMEGLLPTTTSEAGDDGLHWTIFLANIKGML